MTKSEGGKIGGLIGGEIQRQRKIKRIESYLKNPNRCQNCDGGLIYGSRAKFCSQSCAASHNNKFIKRNSHWTNKCKNCSAMIHNRRIFCNKQCSKLHNIRLLEEIIESGIITNRGAIKIIKERLLKKYGKCCRICLHEVWNDLPIPLELDHIDGNSTNWDESNLRIICPNCHAQTPTYKGKNRGNGRAYRRKQHSGGDAQG